MINYLKSFFNYTNILNNTDNNNNSYNNNNNYNCNNNYNNTNSDNNHHSIPCNNDEILFDTDKVFIKEINNVVTSNFEELFFLVFRNMYLRKEIENHLKKFQTVSVKSKKELLEIPNRRYIAKLYYNMNQVINEGDIPFGVQELVFSGHFNKEFDKNVIPSSVKSINMGYWFNKPLKNLPEELETLILGNEFNQELFEGSIPSSVTSLTFSGKSRYNHQFKVFDIPHKVKDLTLPHNYDKEITPIGIIPQSVRSLHMGYYYDSPLVSGTIPDGVTHLVLSENFNQPLKKGTIPPSVTHLVFGQLFDSDIAVGAIPPSVKAIVLSKFFNQPLSIGVLPRGLENLVFGEWFNQPISPGVIPSTVKTLTFSDCFNQNLPEGTIPLSVISLTVGNFFDKPFPQKLNKSIKINGGFNY
ncbi:hypothetical protein DICPUDRAFT_149277 [Dictyostelium purpureum]|uniref:FNIP repeat-containing protein n=1 Tax=Dictyostelium purpureum TaxID=5786 RepID=F0ZD99_DICPU|nr:uncharacterized protein DICPUDRAFT_149277 [Dictyostelium purpureum]EGC38100.1 hypothetical protein DICPUDRAFT_149277 [Dictyostelium purpureum]|eukprot:XP_003285407.1 hypothetical protein DICPUDRAFT_149277 [Dictyostelium purpureum]